ncbi:MAG TPA: SDR family NAD(P)-dependent oxidoreductase [Solirubrobacteraceae bacterium]|jgi:NAD(P)-dependent dehydrogenase (short-subunit alcohol dehydrogenase family)|nr:SDR family NAD(P)-dependent oxidoreductase [Solirubrobacteraceae bacterium]
MGASEFAGRTVLVTGASRGIGLATAAHFAGLGADVGLVSSNIDRLDAAQAGVSGRTHAVAADLTDPAECARAVAEVEAQLGPIDVLISCAGTLVRAYVEDVTPADFEHSYRLHAGAGLWLTQAVLAGMRARGYGRIVLVSSEFGLIGGPSYASYCTSKFALVGLAEVLHHELAGSGVRACVVCPGDVATKQLADEIEWGPTGGTTFDKAMSPARVAKAIERAAAGRAPVVIIDRPHLKAVFNLLGGPRRLRLKVVHDAFKGLLKARDTAS